MIGIVWSKFVGVFLTGIGASYYHLQPDNRTLVWDRLPMILIPVILWLFKSGLGGNLFYRELRQREKIIRAV